MIQDIGEGRFCNAYQPKTADDEDIVIHFAGTKVLCARQEGNIKFPQIKEMKEDNQHWEQEKLQYLFAVDGIDYYLYRQEEKCKVSGYSYEDKVVFRALQPQELCFVGTTAWHLHVWYESHRFCGKCGGKMLPDTKERALTCTCGNVVYPVIAPAVIVAVVDKKQDRIVVTRYANRQYKKDALIAGFVEIGETLEDTVRREVQEEVGLKVKNITYYKSQPWGFDSNLLVGFFAELEGDDTIVREEEELAVAQWVKREEFVVKDTGLSLTAEMMRYYVTQGK